MAIEIFFKQAKSRSKRRGKSSTLAKRSIWFLLFVFPFLLIYHSGAPEWIGRMIADGIFAIVCFICIFWWSLSPNSEIIDEGAKLSRPGYAKSKGVVERIMRITGAMFGIGFFYYITFPFIRDIFDLSSGMKPMKIAGRVKVNNISFGTWFIDQSVILSGGNVSKRSYPLMYSLDARLNVGDYVEFLVLPHSQVVLLSKRVSKSSSD